jgi:outer membrane biosynthesis protein TonB
VKTEKAGKTMFMALFLLMAAYIFPQDEMPERSSIPQELLRPRRGEAPRYPIDMVIGALGQGNAPPEAYAIAQKTTAALLAGNMNVPVLSSVNKVFLEDCMTKLKSINPQSSRLGSGREEPDGSFSFLVRFIGREEGITGELFVRFEERRPKIQPPPPLKETPPEPTALQAEDPQPENSEPKTPEPAVSESAENVSGNENNTAAQAAEPAQVPPANIPAEKVWFFEDLILEEPRSREEENKENRHRFDFSPYERFY